MNHGKMNIERWIGNDLERKCLALPVVYPGSFVSLAILSTADRN